MEGELPGRRYRFGLECARVKSDAARAGALGGSAFWSVFVDVCALEIEAAGERAWRILHRTIITTGAEFSSDLAESLKRCFDEIFSRYCCAEPQDFFRRAMDDSNMGPDLTSSVAHRLEERIVGARRVVYAEIELFARSLQQRPKFERGSGTPTVFQFYAPVAAIQTGAGSSARITLNLDGGA